MDETQQQEPAANRRATPAVDDGFAPPWEMIANGRYMPRRIRGSLRGRELG